VALAIAVTVLTGFWFTCFGPVFAGSREPSTPAVLRVHMGMFDTVLSTWLGVLGGSLVIVAGIAHDWLRDKRTRTGWPPSAALAGFRTDPAPEHAIIGGMFRFPSATKRDATIEAWLGEQSPELGSIARAWFSELRRAGHDVRELMHDGCPVACVGDVAFAYVNVFQSHVNVGFFCGADLDDPGGLLEGAGRRMRHVKLKPDSTCDAVALRHLIEDAYMDIKRKAGGAGGVA
jgi:hypothetical protein